MHFRYLTLGLTFLACLAAARSARGQQVPTHPTKCANPELARGLLNPKGKIPQQTGWSLPKNYDDSLVSPSGRFEIYFDSHNETTDSNTERAYAEHAAIEADSAYDLEIGALGYAPPAPTTGGHYAIFLAPEHAGDGAYGETRILEGGELPNSPSGNERWRAYSVIDNSFSSGIYSTHGYDALRITIFHEFFHVTQFSGYGYPPADYVYFQEMSSVWMEWLSTPYVKDYLQYAPYYLSALDRRLDIPTDIGQYGQYLFFAYLTHRFDTSIVRKIWEFYRDSSTDPVTCIEKVLREYKSSFCQEYQNFGVELMQTNRRYTGHSLLPDAPVFPLDTIQVGTLSLGSPTSFVTDALTLHFWDAGDGPDTCIEIMSRDTNRALTSDGTIEFTSLGVPPTVTLDSPQAYCDSEICLAPYVAVAGLDVHPNPFVTDGSSEAYILASTNPFPPISVAMNIMDLSMNEIRSTKAAAVPFKGSWNALWDGRDDLGRLVPSGEYLYALHVDGALKVGKIVVVRK